jgi:hypothetical protein
MKILVIGAMHGNEPLGPAVVKAFQNRPVGGVDAVIANEAALKNDVRFIEQDLNRSFPGRAKGNAEERRARELLGLCRNYDLVFDFHNTKTPDNDCGFVGENAEPLLYEATWALGLKRVVVADYDCINKYAPNCLSVEISLPSSDNDATVWYERIAQLARLCSFSAPEKLERYRYVCQITLEDKVKLDLPSRDLKAFEQLDAKLTKALGLKSPVYPIFIGGGYTPSNYGGILAKLDL